MISPHQLPLAREIVSAGKSIPDFEFIYVPEFDMDDERRALGWQDQKHSWILSPSSKSSGHEICKKSDFLFSYLRTFDIFKARIANNTVYCSERWFKPLIGIARLLLPSYWRMARCMTTLLSKNAGFFYFPIGIHAARDMARLCGLMHGDLRCLFRAPKLDFERRPGGRIYLSSSTLQLQTPTPTKSKKYCLDKMRMWGYFVEPSNLTTNDQRPTTNDQRLTTNTLKVLWVGRLLKLKRVDTIIRAVGELARGGKFHSPTPTSNSNSSKITLDIYGIGPEEARLKKLAAKYGDVIKFHPPVPIAEVRRLMREHDVYVMSSNGYEGWGAVVSEALEEGMLTLGTHEAGSSATILPESHLFHAGDWRALAELLRKAADGELKPTGIGEWTAKKAAELLVVSARKSKKEVPLTKR